MHLRAGSEAGNVMSADPRDRPFSSCSRRMKEPQAHVWRDGCFQGDGRSACVYCGKRKRKRKLDFEVWGPPEPVESKA